MSKDKIEVSMNVYDIPIVIEELEKAEDEIKKLNDIIEKARKCLKKYKKTNVEDYAKIIELYKEMDSILNNKDN